MGAVKKIGLVAAVLGYGLFMIGIYTAGLVVRSIKEGPRGRPY